MFTTDIRRKFVFGAVAAIAAVTLTSCQDVSFSDGSKYRVMEARITERLNQEYASVNISAVVSTVDCPRSGRTPTPGEEFICLADLDGQAVRVEVAVNDRGFEYSTLDVAYDAAYAAQQLSTNVSEEIGFPVTLNCGEGLKVIPAGDSFVCPATDENGGIRTIEVTADLDGTTWEIVEEAPTPRALGGRLH